MLNLCSLLVQHSYSGKAVDVWALGATLFALVFGNVPFWAENVPSLYERIRQDALVFPVTQKGITDDLRHLIVAMLDKDPASRITLPQIKVSGRCSGRLKFISKLILLLINFRVKLLYRNNFRTIPGLRDAGLVLCPLRTRTVFW